MLRSLFLLVLIAVPAIYIPFSPFVGVMLWTWISSMTPHRLTYGFLYDAPIVYAIALVTLAVIIFRNEIKYLPRHPLVVLVALYVGWAGICTIFALEPRLAFEAWTELLKVTALAFATAVTLRSRKRLYLLLSLLGISFAYYGVKGGLFTILTGGAFRALGAPGSFMEGTNEYATVMLMSLPLMIWLGRHAEWWLLRWMFRVSVPLTVVAILGTQSRGGLVALGVMSLFMALRHRRLMVLVLLVLVAAPVVWEVMPPNWRARMETISEYNKDASFMGRVTMWKAAARSSSDHPIFGVGADGWRNPDFQAKYVPMGEQPREWHSIYFGNLGEYGYPGLFLFVCILFMAIFSCRSLVRVTEGRSELRWAHELALAMQASFVGFAAVGLVMHFPMFDLYFQLIAITAVVVKMVETVLAFERDRSPLVRENPLHGQAGAPAADAGPQPEEPAGPVPAWARFAMAGAAPDAHWRHVRQIDPKYERWRQRQSRLGGFGPRWEPPSGDESDA
ncbi:MAG: putative O-glycosylation ligase, exosortase A system-associated [Alphaproteobacteria bacterium]|nr:MAG: putative O-glycosylation ligase, exosortase A system-associated [Alphaproteobacteria bacterium]